MDAGSASDFFESVTPRAPEPGARARAGKLVLPAPIRELRDLTRYRKSLIEERTRHANRLHKSLEDAGVKLAAVASDILGASGGAMLEALVQGTTDPAVLADLARGKLRTKLPRLTSGVGRAVSRPPRLPGRPDAGTPRLLDKAIGTLSDRLEELLAKLSPEERTAIARKAVLTRWAKWRKQPKSS